jgi:hypothetical protein
VASAQVDPLSVLGSGRHGRSLRDERFFAALDGTQIRH